MAKIKSHRNKTISTSVAAGQHFLQRCLRGATVALEPEEIRDKTLVGDFFELADLLPADSFDLIIADPPYNLTKSFNGRVFNKQSAEQYEEYTRRWLTLLQPLLKADGSIYVCCDWESSLIIGRVLSELFRVRNRITWQREKGRGAKANWKNGQEDIWFATKSDDYCFNLEAVKLRKRVLAPYREDGKAKDWQQSSDGAFRDTCPSNFWDDITIPFWSMAENTEHPTQKPEKLLAKIILASSQPGDLILDPFLGSGSTSVVAKKLQRHYTGIEINEQYCVWAEERLERASSEPEIQGYSEGVFWERNTQALQHKVRKREQ